MKVDRTELLGLLKMLSPALANTKNQVAELSHIWFDGQTASAFNDVLGIRVAYETDFVGGLLGEKLIGVVERSSAKTIDIEVDAGNALLKIGRARIKLACRPIDDWFWTTVEPDVEGYTVSNEFRTSIQLLLMSVGAATVQNPEQRGVTVIQNGKAADLYSTDAMSLSWAHVETGNKPVMLSDRLIMPTPFCEQLVALKSECQLKFDDNSVYCLTEADLVGRKPEKGETRETHLMLLFSRLVDDENPVSFDDVINEHVIDDSGVAVPAQLRACVERAMVLLTEEPLEVEVDEGNLYLFTPQTPYGEIDDELKFPGHPNVKAKLDAALLHRALDGRESMTISKQGVVMRGPKNFLHIVAAK